MSAPPGFTDDVRRILATSHLNVEALADDLWSAALRAPRIADTVTVCSACRTESCWQGDLMCEDAGAAGIMEISRG